MSPGTSEFEGFSPWTVVRDSLHFLARSHGRNPKVESAIDAKSTGAMTKQKTHKSTKKRFRLTATGKVKHRKCGTSHLAIAKPAKKIRQLRGTRVLEPSMTRAIVDALRGNGY